MSSTDDKPRKFPASMTSPQLIALLDEMCSIGCAARSTRLVQNGNHRETSYKLTLSDIHEADALLDMLDDMNAENETLKAP